MVQGMAEPPKSGADQIEKLQALIERLQDELAEQRRLQVQSAEVSAGQCLENIDLIRPSKSSACSVYLNVMHEVAR